MKYGEIDREFVTNFWTGKKEWREYTYLRAEWHEYHTNNYGEGLWIDDEQGTGSKQLLGTCQFSVTGCQTEKAAKAKIRNLVKRYYEYDEEE